MVSLETREAGLPLVAQHRTTYLQRGAPATGKVRVDICNKISRARANTNTHTRWLPHTVYDYPLLVWISSFEYCYGRILASGLKIYFMLSEITNAV